MKRFPIALVALLALAACGNKKAAPAAAAAGGGDLLGNVAVPDDKASEAFATKILTHQITNFSPADNTGLKFVYKTMTFKNDNSWVADAYLGEGQDSIGCEEKGTWKMEPAIDDHNANMEWSLSKSTCPGRPQENIMRVKVTIAQGQYDIKVR